MSSDGRTAPRPLTVAIPTAEDAHGPYCPRRPTLQEILADVSDPPWTLAAFTAYLSSNHCLETLEFTMDASRYRKHHDIMMSRVGSSGLPSARDRDYVRDLWQRLVDAYIRPNGSREVNLPSDVRDPILNLRSTGVPPAPDTLDTAVAKTYELIEESVLMPFLNSICVPSAHPAYSSPNVSDESISRSRDRHSTPLPSHSHSHSHSHPHSHSPFHRPRRAQSPKPPHSAHEIRSHSYSSSPLATSSKPLPLHSISDSSSGSGASGRHLSKLSQTTSSPAQVRASAASGSGNTIDTTTTGLFASASSDLNLSGGPGMTTDDSTSTTTDSPVYDLGPATPPASPSINDSSPKRDSGVWKKLGRLGGMKGGAARKKSHGALRGGSINER